MAHERGDIRPVGDGDDPSGPAWTLTSEPPGAAIWIDGRDTGWVTPIVLRAGPPGRYEIRLRLDGHDDYVIDWRQQAGNHGFQYGVALTPLVARERERAARIDAVTRPSDDARARTRAFLGDENAWPAVRVRFHRGASLGLDAVTIEIRGDGRATVTTPTWDGRGVGRHIDVTLAPDEVRAMLQVFIAEAFTEMIVSDRPGVPDEIHLRIELVNARNQTHAVGKWAGDDHPRFAALWSQAMRVLERLPQSVRDGVRI